MYLSFAAVLVASVGTTSAAAIAQAVSQPAPVGSSVSPVVSVPAPPLQASAPPPIQSSAPPAPPPVVSAPPAVAAPLNSAAPPPGSAQVSIAPVATALPPVDTAICAADKNVESWTTAGVGEAFLDFAVQNAPFPDGVFAALVASIPALSGSEFSCGFDQPCDFAQYRDVCDTNPMAATVLLAMTHYANFYQNLAGVVEDVGNNINGQAADMVNTFGPQPTQEIPEGEEIGAAVGLGLTILGTFAALIPGLQAFGAVAASVGAGFALAGATEAVPSVDRNTFDNFATVTASISVLVSNLRNVMREFVGNQLNTDTVAAAKIIGAAFDTVGLISPVLGALGDSPEYDQDPNQLPQLLLPGDFANSPPDIPQAVSDALTAAMAAPVINELWTKARVVVVKTRASDYSDPNSDPCTGTGDFSGVFPQLCDSEGALLTLQAMPFDLRDGRDFYMDPKNNAAPGFDRLADFNIDPLVLMTSAVNNQAAHGLLSSGESPDAFAARIKALNPADIDLAQSVFFTIAVCDLSLFQLNDFQKKSCPGEAPNRSLCEFYMKLFVGCGKSTIGDKEFPYRVTEENVI